MPPQQHWIIGLPDESALRVACRSVAKPFNYVAGCGPTRFALTELKEFGVRRVTIGTSFCRAGLTAVVRAAREVLGDGTFNYVDGIDTVADFNELIDPLTRSRVPGGIPLSGNVANTSRVGGPEGNPDHTR